jgi:ureidoacrylate peracid hydrolase
VLVFSRDDFNTHFVLIVYRQQQPRAMSMREGSMVAEPSSLASLVGPRHTAVLVVDVELRFTQVPLSPPLSEVLPRMHRFLEAARAANVPRVFSRAIIPSERWTGVWKDQHPDPQAALALAPESPLVAFAPGFEPDANDLSVVKERYSSFVGTKLANLLEERNIKTVVLVGLTTDVCVSSTARDAFHHEFHTVTLSDRTAEQNLARHEAGLASLAAAFGRVCTSDDILAAWSVGAVPSTAP